MGNTVHSISITATSIVQTRLVLTGAALFATMCLLMLATTPALADAEEKRGITGSVLSVGETSFRLAARSGLQTIFVDANTAIKRGRKDIPLSDINPGDRVSASLEPLQTDLLLAAKIKVRGKSTEKQVQHLTGVVIERGEGFFRLASRNGTSVEIEAVEGSEPPTVAEVVTTIVENDPATGRLQAKQIERVEKIVQRLEDSLSKQVDKAKAAVLKRIIDESARQHLDTLNQTLDQVEAESKQKISAALTKFRADYAAVAVRVGNAAPEESYGGVIASISQTSISVGSSTSDGSRTFTIGPDTAIVVDGTANASTLDLIAGQSVIVRFVPAIDAGNSVEFALVIEALPPALPPIVANAIEDLSEDVIQGKVAVVESDPASGVDVIIIDEDGTGDTLGVEITDTTVITVDSQAGTVAEIEPGQQVEVTVEEDGVTAETAVVTTDMPSPEEQSISGIVSGNDFGRRVIIITPGTGSSLRLEVSPDALITVDGAVATLDQVREPDIVLTSSLYLPESKMLTRLAVAHYVPEGGDTPGSSPGSSSDNPDPVPGPGSSTEGQPETQPLRIRGIVKSVNGESILLDGMRLPTGFGFSMPEGLNEGSEVDLVFTILEDGRLILTGIQPPQ